jgi:nucleotide-binding universal stress UspA family protein
VANLYRQGDFLYIVHVVPDYLHTSSTPGPGSIFYPGASLDEDQEHDLEEQAQDFIQEFFVADAASKGIEVNVVLVRDYRHLGKAVCKKAEELEAAPLVLAAHHKNAFEEMMLGSISKFCATNCKRPVLLVHPEHSMI